MKKIIFCLLASSVITSCQKDCPEPEPDPNTLSCKTKLDSGLLAYYPFNGNFNDESGNGLNATPKNGAFTTTDFLGRTGKAAGFDGVNDYAIVAGNSKLNSPAMTVAFQVLVNSTNRRNSAISRINFDNASGHIFGIHQSIANVNRWDFAVGPSTNDCSQQPDESSSLNIFSEQNIQTGRWYSIIASFGNGSQKLYVDGVLVASRQQPFNALKQCTTADLMIGGWWSFQPISIDGKLDEVRFYNRVLTDCEIDKLG